MNIEKIYRKLKNLENLVGENNQDLQDVLKELEVEKVTNGKVNKSIISCFNKLVKINELRPAFQQIYMSKNNSYCLCNGYFLVDYGENLENIPKNLTPFINNKDYDKDTTIDYERTKNTNIDLKTEKIQISDIEKVYKYNKVTKKRICYVIDNKLFNAEYLLDVAKLSGQKTKELVIENDLEQRTPINIIFENGIKAILLPIRREQEEFEQNKLEFNKILGKEEN